MAGERTEIVLATKYLGATRTIGRDAAGNSRKNRMDAGDTRASRASPPTYIDLLWVARARLHLHHADRRW